MRRALILAAALAATPALGAEFRWASRTDPATLDPHAQSSAPVLGFLNNVYEGLVRRDPEMSVEPALATSWEPLGARGWRFFLREGVTFHDGAAFDARDVVFSYERAASEQSDVASWFAGVTDVVAQDALTVDFLTARPDPIFPGSIANFMIMDSGWAEANGAARPDRQSGNHATLNANGTGPYRVTLREPGTRTALEPFEDWWGAERGNVSRAVMRPVQNPATAIAALLSGAVDLVEPIPIQDVERLRAAEDVHVAEGIEARVIMLGFSHDRETVHGGDAPNPFRSAAVRDAVARAVDVEAIDEVVMRGAVEPASQIIDPASTGFSEVHAARPDVDPAAARAAITAAGFEGAAVTFACPNDRYINDEAVCQAITAMLAQAGLAPQLVTMPVAQYWPALREGAFDMYLLGWSAGTFDAEHPIRFLAHTPDPEARLGSWNFGGYSNARVDALLPAIRAELDEDARQAMLDEVMGILREDTAYVPLYVQPLLWGVREGVEVVQRADNFLILRWVEVAE